jgi:hypothetical protein
MEKTEGSKRRVVGEERDTERTENYEKEKKNKNKNNKHKKKKGKKENIKERKVIVKRRRRTGER